MSLFDQLSSSQLRKAAALKETIAKIEKQLASILGSPSTPAKPQAAKKVIKRRKMSAAARAKISAAVKARWARVKAAKKG